ncbi:MAG TPA: hypothetical protein VLA29_12000 [Acidimicrobiia bacterium]|nr:hypothetical protein [Acidimicrobiia bacterium]
MPTDEPRIRGTGPTTPIRVLAVAAVMLGVITGCGSASETSTSTQDTTTTTTAAPAASPLVGSWERTGGNYSVLQGMIVEVDEAASEGTITEVPRNPFQFRVGDVKWASITAVSGDRFRIFDLSRESGTGTASRVTGVITVADGGETLEIRFSSTGTIQIWSRVP